VPRGHCPPAASAGRVLFPLCGAIKEQASYRLLVNLVGNPIKWVKKKDGSSHTEPHPCGPCGSRLWCAQGGTDDRSRVAHDYMRRVITALARRIKGVQVEETSVLSGQVCFTRSPVLIKVAASWLPPALCAVMSVMSRPIFVSEDAPSCASSPALSAIPSILGSTPPSC
jgi:hypothetical protein